ncbi:hypothetical protein [Natronorubrum aibiense]|uniref:Uncharacterized protein n=1 Tax=Natronorubrum aibiense TaxID=348826 RepID=A0A5P9P4D9_9EURY|nr:hypothetical protein [Natronorubrum aibiense]QFU82936.1 hypothetical protein GCU68_10535 [Natronorubrum aibiense]
MTFPPVAGPLHEFWSFYRGYTHTAIHTAATAALAIFGILVFVDPWFAALAIGSYVLPPVILYVFEPSFAPKKGPTSPDESDLSEPERSATPRAHANSVDRSPPSGGNGDTDTDSDRVGGDTDTDSDRDDGDSDSDTDDGDTDSDSNDGDSDSDSDG